MDAPSTVLTAVSSVLETDAIVIGGGPAGAATAIAARTSGLRVTLLDRDAVPRERPGEAVHPGVELLLARLGVLDAVLAADFLRHSGHWVQWGRTRRGFVPYGSDHTGVWRGFQVWRPSFDAILLAHAGHMGATIVRPCRCLEPLIEGGQVVGVATSEGTWRARFVIDATGRQRWLARALGLPVEQAGSSMVAWFGYARGDCPVRDDAPAIVTDRGGWTWTARVRPRLYQWVRIARSGDRPPRGWLPTEFADLEPVRHERGIDVTWTRARPSAGPGYFLAGDAACVLDPASSQGMLKALTSGMLAAQLAAAVLRGQMAQEVATHAYDVWVKRRFEIDCAKLREFYAELGDGFGLAKNPSVRLSG